MTQTAKQQSRRTTRLSGMLPSCSVHPRVTPRVLGVRYVTVMTHSCIVFVWFVSLKR